MNGMEEKETSLKWLFYRVLRAWKAIVLFSIAIALVVGMVATVSKVVKLNDEKFMAEERADFDRSHASWETAGNNYKLELVNLEESKARQVTYNENSILMKIDPLNKYVGSVKVSVAYTPPDDNTLSYAPADKVTPKVLAEYEQYIKSDMYEYVQGKLGGEIALNYLTEIFTVDYSNAKSISIAVVHYNETTCGQILGYVKDGIDAKKDAIDELIDDVDFTVAGNVSVTATKVSSETDLKLMETQTENISKPFELDKQIDEAYAQLRAWKKTAEPTFEYTKWETAKSVILITGIGGVVAFFVLCVGVAVMAAASRKLRNPEDVKSCFRVQLFGSLPRERVKNPPLGAKLTALCGVTIRPEEYDALAALIASSIRTVAEAQGAGKDWKRIAFTGTVSAEELEKAVAAMGITEYETVCAPNVLTEKTAVDAIATADAVVLVETQETTVLDDVGRELELLRAWDKPVLGAVVVNADAIM